MKLWTRQEVPRGCRFPLAWLCFATQRDAWAIAVRLPLFSHESRYVMEWNGYELGWWIPVLVLTRDHDRKLGTYLYHERHGSMASDEDVFESTQQRIFSSPRGENASIPS